MNRRVTEEIERTQLRDAMERLLAGAPLHSDGKLTVKSLASEAQLKRWVLTHKHVDLQAEFRARVAQLGQVPHAVQLARAESAALREQIKTLAGKLEIERQTVKRLERVVQVLTLERDQGQRVGATVHTLRNRQ